MKCLGDVGARVIAHVKLAPREGGENIVESVCLVNNLVAGDQKINPRVGSFGVLNVRQNRLECKGTCLETSECLLMWSLLLEQHDEILI